MLQEFKKFIMRGNIVDLAVAVIMGGAFNSIVTSLVEDIIMPLVGVLMGGVQFEGLSVVVGDATVKYGMFIQSIVNFLIIAVSIFIMIKALEKARSLNPLAKEEEEEEEIPEPSNEEVLLTEIRDLLKEQK